MQAHVSSLGGLGHAASLRDAIGGHVERGLGSSLGLLHTPPWPCSCAPGQPRPPPRSSASAAWRRASRGPWPRRPRPCGARSLRRASLARRPPRPGRLGVGFVRGRCRSDASVNCSARDAAVETGPSHGSAATARFFTAPAARSRSARRGARTWPRLTRRAGDAAAARRFAPAAPRHGLDPTRRASPPRARPCPPTPSARGRAGGSSAGAVGEVQVPHRRGEVQVPVVPSPSSRATASAVGDERLDRRRRGVGRGWRRPRSRRRRGCRRRRCACRRWSSRSCRYAFDGGGEARLGGRRIAQRRSVGTR